MNTRYFPWLDRAGRLSWLKLVVFAALFAPGLWIALRFAQGALGPKPVTEAIHRTGTWAIYFLLLSLAVSPLRRLGAWGKLIAVRRMLGLAVLAYACAHLTLYVVDEHGNIVRVVSEIVLRFYLTIGFVALLGFAVLGSTSTDGMIRRLGPGRWNRLHSVVYGLGLLALWHFALQSKLDVTQPVLMAGLFLLLMGYRVLQARGLAETVWALLALSVAAALGDAMVEAGWYRIVNHVPMERVLEANFDFSDTLRPAWWVLIAGLATVALRLARPLWARRTPPARRTAEAARAGI